MSTVPVRKLTPAEYLAQERAVAFKIVCCARDADDRCVLTETADPEGCIGLSALQITLPVPDIYRRGAFDAAG